MEWKAQSVRFTAFTLAPPSARGMFHQLTGVEPESATERPRDGLFIESGSHAGRRLTLTFIPGRVQLELQAPEAEEYPFAVFAAEYRAVLQESLAVGKKWLEALTPRDAIVRLAFGAVMLCEFPDRAAVYAALRQLLPSLQLDVNASDLLYRVNRPRSSAVLPQVLLNRLSTWQAAELQQVVITAANASSGIAAHISTSARLELDINTDARRMEPLPLQASSAILGELVAQGTEIAARGERA